ncbi:MAG TPA: Hsp20/alpha crystallin family protein [Anaeromyxobacter sp.]|nr:Hsp20/alpha crystallin family protein [Anaeromyxobacter sp.]
MANLIRRGSPSAVLAPRLPDPFEMMRDLLRWDPFAEFGSPRGELAFAPSFEVKETKDAYLFKADLPGIAEGDLDIALTGNRLTVSGKREEEKKEEDDRYYAFERSYGSFSRSFTLPEGVDVDHAEAGLSQGVLTVSIPKKPEAKPKKIEVKRLAAKGEKGQA